MAANAALENQLLAATKIIENQLDNEMERLDNLDTGDLDAIRRQRLEAMKKRAKKKEEWLANGHGEYSELYDEKEFFETTKKSENIICHFYREGFQRCKILDKHLNILAKKHVEAKFCKINAEKSPFLTERLHIRILPTLCLVKDGKTRDFVVGFSDLGNTDEFTTEVLEWRVARADVIEYTGDLMVPPVTGGQTGGQKMLIQKKTIRGREEQSDDDSD